MDIVANELANMKLAGFDGKCKSDNHYDNFFRSPWAPDLSQEQRHKQLMMVNMFKNFNPKLRDNQNTTFLSGILQVVLS